MRKTISGIVVLCAFLSLAGCQPQKIKPTVSMELYIDRELTGDNCQLKAGDLVKTVVVNDGDYTLTLLSQRDEKCPGGTIKISRETLESIVWAGKKFLFTEKKFVGTSQRRGKSPCTLFADATIIEVYQQKSIFVVGRNPYSNEAEKQFACPVGDRLIISKDDENIF